MPLSPVLQATLDEVYLKMAAEKTEAKNQVRRGADIFAGTDYPQTWEGFVGQDIAVKHLRSHIRSVDERGADRLDHILLASGLHGIGKTTLAMLIAGARPGTGFVEVSGPVDVEKARSILRGMDDGDVLFWDEIHQAVAGGKAQAEWLLPFLTDGVLLTGSGREQMPNVTIVGATTDLGKLPQTIISRFMVRPKLVPYTPEQGVELVRNLARRMRMWVDPEHFEAIATAANCNPRDMRMILTAVRDLPEPDAEPLDLALALEWAGFTEDGLTTVACDMLLVLLGSKDHTASIDTIQAQLGEPGTLRHHEQVLLQRGYTNITGRGRVLTDEGIARAIRAVQERA